MVDISPLCKISHFSRNLNCLVVKSKEITKMIFSSAYYRVVKTPSENNVIYSCVMFRIIESLIEKASKLEEFIQACLKKEGLFSCLILKKRIKEEKKEVAKKEEEKKKIDEKNEKMEEKEEEGKDQDGDKKDKGKEQKEKDDADIIDEDKERKEELNKQLQECCSLFIKAMSLSKTRQDFWKPEDIKKLRRARFFEWMREKEVKEKTKNPFSFFGEILKYSFIYYLKSNFSSILIEGKPLLEYCIILSQYFCV